MTVFLVTLSLALSAGAAESILVANPEWGFVAVVFWSVFTSMILVLRLLYAVMIRLTQGPLSSWLSEDDVATGPNARTYAIFGTTRGAYAPK